MGRILVVEDSADIRTLVSTILEREGHAVASAGSGDAAMRWVRANGPPDLAVLDVGLPDTDGRALLRDLRAEGGADLPAVFLTGHADQDAIESGEALGARYLTKPFSMVAFLEAVEASLR